MYGRMLFVMVLSLYTVQFLLRVLGIEDYGIYDVVAGLVSMLAMISGTMETATQRYFSFAIGENKKDDIKHIFSLSISIYLLISLLIVILGETIGLWFVNSHLQIPVNRIIAANWIYQFALFSIIISMLIVPYSSLIIAYENMGLFSIITMIDSVLKLAIVYSISIFNADKLIIYGGLGLFIVIIKLIIFIYFSRAKYVECRYTFYWDSKLFKSMLSYSGWTLFGVTAGVANNQGNNILINIFFGPAANAARGIAFQVSNVISSFCNNLFVVMRPPMIKSYAEKNNTYMMYLFYLSSRLSFFLMLLIFLPLFIETELILKLWLGQINENMIIFTRLTLIYTLILAQHNPITTIMQATGRVKIYFSIVESTTLLSLPLTYLFFKLGYPVVSTFYVSIIVFFLAHFLRLYILQMVIKFSMKEYFKKFVFPIILVSILSVIMPLFIYFHMQYGIVRLLVIILSSSFSILILIYFIGIDKSERNKLVEIALKTLKNKRS